MRNPWLLAGVAGLLAGSPAPADNPYPRSVPLPKGSPEPAYVRATIPARDDTRLVVHEWAPPGAPASKPVLVLVPGIGMHGEPYASIAAGFTSRGITLVVPDLRGHGRSEGPRGELAEPHVLRADLGAVLDWTRGRHPGAPVVLAGESMGGLLAADYAWRGEKRLEGLVLLAPAFGLHLSRLQPSPQAVNWRHPGRVVLDAENALAASTWDREFVRARVADPLAQHEVKPTYLLQIAGLWGDCLAAAGQVRLPLFVAVAGKDRVVDNAATGRFYNNAGTPKGERTWARWDEARHTLCWDPATPQVVEAVAAWVLERKTERAAEKKANVERR